MSEPKKEIKIAMVIDDHKLSNKAVWWQKCLDQRPDIEQKYDLIREEVGKGPNENTTTLYRYYQLRDLK